MAPNPPCPCPRGHFSPPSPLLNKTTQPQRIFPSDERPEDKKRLVSGTWRAKKTTAGPATGAERGQPLPRPLAGKSLLAPCSPGFGVFTLIPLPAPAPHLFSQSFIDPSMDRGLGSPQKSLEIIDISGDNKRKLSGWPSFLLKLQYSGGFGASRSVKNGARASGIRLLLP